MKEKRAVNKREGVEGKSRNRNTGMQGNEEVPPNSGNFGEE